MRPFASIVIPVFNQIEYTKKCIDSLLRDPDRPNYELIVVDNGSSDGTREYLENLQKSLDRTRDKMSPIFNAENRGVAPAWNQGAQAATTDYIAILNNDLLLSTGWFRSLLWALDYHHIHLVSPFAATGPLNYDLDARALRFGEKNLAKLWNDYDFCAFLLKRAIYEDVGPFDENFLVGGYEDTDYCYRMKALGLKYGVSGAAFIHHFGSSTLGEFKKRGDKHVGHNKEYFISKWKEDPAAQSHRLERRLARSVRKLKLKWDRM